MTEAVLTLAYLQPETLADFHHLDTETALWRYSLETDTLVFNDKFVRTSDYTEETNVSSVIGSVEDFVETPKERLKSLSTKQVRRFLLDKANRWKPAIEAIRLPVAELTNERLQRELRVIQYVLLDNLKAYEGILAAIDQSEEFSTATRELFNERVVSEKTGIPKTTLRSTLTWIYVQRQLDLRRAQRVPQNRVGFEGVEATTAASPTLPPLSLTKQRLRDEISTADIDAAEKESLLQHLNLPDVTAMQVSELLKMLRPRNDRD